MPSTYDVEKLAYDSSAIVELLLLCSELVPTFAKQFGPTVISPIASDDVHFRNSSIDAGYNYQTNMCFQFKGKKRNKERKKEKFRFNFNYNDRGSANRNDLPAKE